MVREEDEDGDGLAAHNFMQIAVLWVEQNIIIISFPPIELCNSILSELLEYYDSVGDHK